MENKGSLGYKLYKTISFISSTSFLFFDFIINESNSCSFSIFCDRIQSQFLNFLTTTCGTKLNHGMIAKAEGMGKEMDPKQQPFGRDGDLGPVIDVSGRLHGCRVTASCWVVRDGYSTSDIPTTPASIGLGMYHDAPGSFIQPPSIPTRIRMPHDPYTPLPYYPCSSSHLHSYQPSSYSTRPSFNDHLD
ncbi:hypothetical protein M9H77_06973 [Catharanthus roseus]|uniref:Uncharacterized protein n=1 Tax=Catharanthus roseus TaxID=4058 RepID=A0ACC0BTV1_CATRO|nr:hypothetical protein M9H77_06973 [Catharanthus roseus]